MPAKDLGVNKLIELNDELENYFRNTIIPQLFVDGNLRLKKFTPSAMTQFTLSDNDIGKFIGDIIDNFRFPTIIEDIQQVVNSNEILEKEIQTTDLRWYQMNIVPYIERQNKRTNGVIITFVEITARIQDLIEQEKLTSEHESLLDMISHDIRSPIGNIKASLDLLKNYSCGDNSEYASLLHVLEKSVSKMYSVINELTDTQKEKHKYKAEDELLNFDNILDDVCLTITHTLKESGTIINKEVSVSEIKFPKRKLRSIVYNLLTNAIKFRSPDRNPEILIKTKHEKDFVVISVQDNGIGIDPGKEGEIFSKYFRIENDIEGSGVGLYLVKKMVSNSGGKIEVKSKPGKGTEFLVYLKAG